MEEYESDVRHINDLKRHIPKEVFEKARKEVLESGNQGVWTMCMVAVEMLASFWNDEHRER